MIFRQTAILLLFLTATFVTAHSIGAGLQLQVVPKHGLNHQEFQIRCRGNEGKVRYSAEHLPPGIYIRNDVILVTDKQLNGVISVTIKAEDEAGQKVERNINLKIQRENQAEESGPSPTPEAPEANNRLNDILGAYSIASEPQKKQYSGNRFPTDSDSLPTGADPNALNLTPLFLQNRKATPSERNRNPITVDDVAMRAASERHQNAIKSITNLLKIIDQARANKLQGEEDIEVYIRQYNEALGTQREAQNSIVQIQTRVAQIDAARAGLSEEINDLRSEIDEGNELRESQTQRKNELIATISSEEGERAELIEELNNLNKVQLAEELNLLADKQVQCQQINSLLNKKLIQLDESESDLQRISEERDQAEAEVEQREQQVNELRNKLSKAQKKLSAAKVKLTNIDLELSSLPDKIDKLKEQIEDLQSQAQACQDELERIQDEVDKLRNVEVVDLTNRILELEESVLQNRNQLSQLDSELTAGVGELQDLNLKLEQATDDFNFLKEQKILAEEILRQSYLQGNDANTIVAQAKDNIEAAIVRLDQQTKIVTDATLNLEKARAQQKLARLHLEEIIAKYSDALPYAIVPNGNLETNPGTPFGNNPSGSPLGEIKLGGNGAPGSFKISNWKHYLSSAFGAGINPAFQGSVNELFPFSFSSIVNGNIVTNPNLRNQCNRRPIQNLVADGFVIDIGADYFNIEDESGTIYRIEVDDCSKLNSNHPNYKIKLGDEAIAKGYSADKHNTIKGGHITCLS